MTHRIRIFGLLLFVIVILQSCYSFSATTLPAHIKRIRIGDVENLTTNPTLGVRIRDAVVETLRRNASAVRIVNGNDSADAEILVTLASYANEVGTYSSTAQVETNKSVLVTKVLFTDLVYKKTIYENRSIRSEGIYSLQLNESEELHGQQRAIENLQEIIINNALSQW